MGGLPEFLEHQTVPVVSDVVLDPLFGRHDMHESLLLIVRHATHLLLQLLGLLILGSDWPHVLSILDSQVILSFELTLHLL